MHFRIENSQTFLSTKCQQALEITIFSGKVKLKINDSRIMSLERYQNKIVRKE